MEFTRLILIKLQHDVGNTNFHEMSHKIEIEMDGIVC